MTRRDWLALSTAAPLTRLAAQAPYPGVSYRNYAQCLPAYLKALAEAAYRKRLADLEHITTPELLTERRRSIRQTFWQIIGGQPERTPLNARTIGTVQRAAYRIDKVIYDSRPGFPVTANLYVPTRPGRAQRPAVLLHMGHGPTGKAHPTYQRCAQGLAQLGFVVLAFDPMGQGERIYYPDSSGRKSRLGDAVEEHSTAGRQMLLTGDTATRLQTWDAIRSLDFLASRPFVDRTRIATTGQSGGATVSMMLLAADDRLAAAVLCSGNTENYACADYLAPGSTDDAEQNLLNGPPQGLDRWDLLYPFAGKPLLISVSDKDFFGTYSPRYISSGWEEFQRLKRFYTLLGKPDQLAWGGTPLPHALEYDTRLLIYNWLLRWLRPEIKPITEEPPTRPEPEETLLCTESGNTVRSLQSLTPHSLNLKRLARPPRPEPLDRLLAVDRTAYGPLQSLRTTIGRGVSIEAIEVPSAPHVWVPAWLYQPRPARPGRPLVVLLDGAGRNTDWHEGELCQTLAQQGFAVCAPDLRGIGDLAPEMAGGNPRHARRHNEEEEWAWASLVLGKPLLGQRVTDLLALLRGLRAHPALTARPIVVAAQGRLAVVAQCAAALSPLISRLYVTGGLVSFRSLAETENYGHAFSNFIPNILSSTDLPDITAQIGARRVTLAGMLDGAGRRLDPQAVRRVYDKVKNLDVLDQANWSTDLLVRLFG